MASGIDFRYPTGDWAIRGLDLQIAAGERVAVCGPSGSGKSTLLGLVAGLRVPSRGSVHLGAVEISALGAHERAAVRQRSIGIVFQDGHLLSELSCVDNVALALRLSGIPKRSARRAALDLLGRVGLREMSERSPSELSGGQRQRIAVARSIANEPSYLLADEPTGSLDRRTAFDTFSLILDVAADLNATVIVATHDLHVAERCDRTIQLVDGAVVQCSDD